MFLASVGSLGALIIEIPRGCSSREGQKNQLPIRKIILF
jgi:hypothetical protein